MDGLYFCWIGFHSTFCNDCALKGDPQLSRIILFTIEHKTIFVVVSIRQIKDFVKFWGVVAKYADIIMGGNDSKQHVVYLIHPDLEDILAHPEARGHT